MNIPEAIAITGTLSNPGKMPCHSTSIPAARCITGAKLAKIEGSICSSCYALKGRYGFPNVQTCLEKRFQGLTHPKWIEAMALLINMTESSGFFRWHDSGDLQGVWHLTNIAKVCELTPNIQHWLPTREYGFVSQFLALGNVMPSNLNVRLSAFMFDGPTPDAVAQRTGCTVSGAGKAGFTCPSSSQGNKCLSCRACWKKDVFSITYKKH